MELSTDINSPILDEDTSKIFEEIGTLCDYIFFRTKEGKRLLALLEYQYYCSPVAPPNQSAQYANFREGENNLLRSFRAWAKCSRREPGVTQEIKREINNAAKQR